ncbi:MAG: DNA-binding protein WhiA [Clostridiales bacterium]|nr:DNA-binding protein WhiA [Clostridiales bacterium]MDY3745978.1 DNA-binding protein WhiA [Lachnospiraceae bacterium]
MSFSAEVKEELSRHVPEARHCCIAELSAIFELCGRVIYTEKGKIYIKIHTENVAVARKYFTLLKKSFNIIGDVSVKRNIYLKKSCIYTVTVADDAMSRKILLAARLMNFSGEIEENYSLTDNLIIQNPCCRRAYLRGSFLAAGSISDPQKTYHFEITCTNAEKAEQLQQMMIYFEVDAKVVLRKKYYVVYVKDGSQIVDMLNVMEAHNALMALENIRIAKEIRNSVNRQVNCEMANINKTVLAAKKQVEDILYIKNTVGFGELTEGLREMAQIRIEYPEASLVELGRMLSSPVGKSGVNHRLRKLSQIADELRERK